MRMLRQHSIIAIIYFLIIALLGVTLRLFGVIDIPANYKFLVHTHSHVALLGWVYTALITLIYYLFIYPGQFSKKYRLIFWFTQVTILGMLLSFPFTGYALFSIVFSSLFLVASYWFVFFFFKRCPVNLKETRSYKLIRISLWYMVISSIGPWALGIIMNTAGSGSAWYRNAIYFFLHFQYNGWFLVAITGIFLYILEKRSFVLSDKAFKSFYYLLNTGVILTFFQSLLWMDPHWIYYLLALSGGLFQLLAFGILFREVFSKGLSIFKKLPKLTIFTIQIATLLLFIKLIAQISGSFPVISAEIFTNLDFIISYIHWIFLGIVSLALMAFLNYFELIKLTRTNLYIYLAGFFLTELLIFSRGLYSLLGLPASPYIALLISIASILLLLAIGHLLINQIGSKKEPKRS